MQTFTSIPSRKSACEQLTNNTFDILVVGGGITGAGIARLAAQQGHQVALIDSNDFASGTSSKSSKLIHGGLRYLAMAEFNLVRQGALARKQVNQEAPHLAEPRWMVLPAENRLKRFIFQLGISVYERLGQVPGHLRHSNWDKKILSKRFPYLKVG